MANPFCLIGQHANGLLTAIRSGAIDPVKLAQMSSNARRAEFAKVVGERNAEPLNAAFESKLLLKNQQQGLINWITQSTQKGSPIQRDLLARVDRMDQRILSPAQLKDFLADLAKQKLGFGVTMQEAGQITQLARDARLAKMAIATGGDRMAYGRARVAFTAYVAELKNGVKQPRTFSGALKAAGGFTKSINASFDNSALFNQGLKVLYSKPGIWLENAAKSFVDIAKELGGKAVMDETNAEIISRPNAINNRYQRAGLATATTEEAFPESPIGKIPGVGRIYKASESAFTGFLHKTRADVFDNYITIAESNGRDVDETAFLQSLGKMVNSMTGRGHLGKAEGMADVLNLAFFSPRKMAGDLDFLTMHAFRKDVDPFVRKQAAINLGRYVVGTSLVLLTAKGIDPESVELNPTSSDFGTIKHGNTRFDITGGERTIAVLAARLMPILIGHKPTTKSGNKVTTLNTGKYGATTGLDLIIRYFTNKASPVGQVVVGRLKGENFDHSDPTLGNDLLTLFAPMGAKSIAKNAQDKQMDDATRLAAMIAEGLGVNTNTYSTTKKKKH